MICMSTSLPTSIKLPNRIAGCGVPDGTCSVPCAAAHDALANSTTPMSAICVQRFMVSPYQHCCCVCMPCISARCKQTFGPEGYTKLALMLLGSFLYVFAPPFSVDTFTEGKQSSVKKPNIFLKTS